jgi:hypothetical protein
LNVPKEKQIRTTGDASINLVLPFEIAGNLSITATATTEDSNTSEFSRCIQVSRE